MKIKHNGNECDVPEWATEQAYKNGYAKGVEEFAEMLKVNLKGFIGLTYIDRMAKEMVGEDNGK